MFYSSSVMPVQTSLLHSPAQAAPRQAFHPESTAVDSHIMLGQIQGIHHRWHYDQRVFPGCKAHHSMIVNAVRQPCRPVPTVGLLGRTTCHKLWLYYSHHWRRQTNGCKKKATPLLIIRDKACHTAHKRLYMTPYVKALCGSTAEQCCCRLSWCCRILRKQAANK
jgi:hypothetical protein